MKKQLLMLVTLVALVFTACGQDQDKNTDQDQNQTQKENNLPDKVEGNLQDLLNEYYDLKENLVEADPEDAVKNAQSMQDIIEEINGSDVQGLKARLKELQIHVNQIVKSSDIEEQRKHFEGVSNEMYEIVNRYRFNNQTVYRQYCPMAFDDRGAYWLSDEEKIRNPYFGDRMLKCGSVEDEIE